MTEKTTKEMETKPETKEGKMQLKDYVRWFFVVPLD